jgi:hypothetical protein
VGAPCRHDHLKDGNQKRQHQREMSNLNDQTARPFLLSIYEARLIGFIPP